MVCTEENLKQLEQLFIESCNELNYNYNNLRKCDYKDLLRSIKLTERVLDCFNVENKCIDSSVLSVIKTDSFREIVENILRKYSYSIKSDGVFREFGVKDSIQNMDPIKLYIEQMKKYPMLTPKEEKELFTQYVQTRDLAIRKRIAEANLRLVVSIAQKYRYRGEFLDIIQSGNVGLMYAIEQFDINFGTKFSTYAVPWIHKTIDEYFMLDFKFKGGTRSEYFLDCKMYRIEKALENVLPESPTVFDIAKELEVSVEDVNRLQSIKTGPISLDSTTKLIDDEECETELLYTLSDDTMDDTISRILLKADLKKAVDGLVLTPQETYVLRKRLVLLEPTPQRKMSRQMGISQTMVGKIEKKILQKLNKQNNHLKCYLD